MFNDRLEAALLAGIGALKVRFYAGRVFTGFEVDALLDFRRAVFAQAIEAARTFAADPALLEHSRNHGNFTRDRDIRVRLGQQRKHGLGQMRHQVDANEILKAEDAGFGNSERARSDGVGFVTGKAKVERFDHGVLHPIDADAIADEARRIFRDHNALAEAHVTEVAHHRQRILARFRSAHDLKQAHIARRVEEVRDHEVRNHALGHAARQFLQRNG